LKILDENLQQIQGILLTTGIVMLMISPLGGYWLASRATRPIADINMIARTLQPSRLTDRLPISGTHDELDELSIQINGLLDRLAAYIDRQRTFTANAAHELRSPLAAIKNTMEIALHEHRTIAEYQELLGTIGTECDHLHLLVNQLLTLAETESEHSSRVSQRVSLDQILIRSKEMFQAAAEDKHVHLSIERLEAVEIMGDPKQVRQVVNNLLDNAIKFNRENGRIVMNLRVDPVNSEAVLTISDTGSGIPAEDLPYLFERFFRGDKSHSRSQIQGNGLGLSICHAIVASMHGKMSVTSQVNVGTTFVVTLPLSKPGSQSHNTPTSFSKP
jgi:signal transduction histidine kinase